MTGEEAIKLLESDGWRSVKQDARYQQWKHDSRAGTVTLCGQPQLQVPLGVLRALLRTAQIEEKS